MTNCWPLFGCLVALLALTYSGKARRLNQLTRRTHCNIDPYIIA